MSHLNEDVESSWGLYPWFEEHGAHLVHGDDVDELRKLMPYGKVFLRTGSDQDGFITIAYGTRTFRVKPDLFRSIPPITFPIGTRVTIRSKDGDAVVDEIQWHHRDAKPIYFVRRNDKRDSRRYSSDELTLAPPQ
jgi:hypothetical protein